MDPSSGRDRDPKSSTSDSEPENPFVKFRRTVDSQVSSLLQGIIGLPSAFSKRPSDDNRWADIDEDLRRRDQQQVRQELLRKQFSEAEATESEKAPADKHAPADYQMQLMLLDQQTKKRVLKARAEQEQEQERLRNSAPTNTEDVEVEIPVKKASQWREPQTSDQLRPYWGSSDGSKETANSEKQNDLNVRDLPLYSPITLELFDHLKQSNSTFPLGDITHGPLEATRHLTFDFLKKSPLYHGDYSLLPYLLFSPYSPLKLSADARVPDTRTRDQFPYCSAFKDLIQTTALSKDDDQCRRSIPSLIYSTGKAGRTVQDNWTWITDLYFNGLLQQKKTVPAEPALWLSPMSALAGTVWHHPETLRSSAGTELELFEQLVGLMPRMPPSQDMIHSIFEALFSQDQQRNRRGMGPNDLQDMIEQARQRAELNAQRIRDSQSSVYFNEKSVQGTEKTITKNVSDTDRIVSTSTTTERTTHEDGTVETCVTVWKQYSDGRETTTTTTHTEDPGREGPDFDWRSAVRDQGEKDFKEVDKDEKKKTEKKGWFWN